MPATLSVCLSRVPSSNPFVVSDAWPCQEQGLPYNQALCTVQAYFYRHMVGLPVCNLSCEIKEVFLLKNILFNAGKIFTLDVSVGDRISYTLYRQIIT